MNRRRFIALTIIANTRLARVFAAPSGSLLHSAVDERVELLSILFRLAGSPEYNGSKLTKYTSTIDRVFSPYKAHPAVTMARELTEKNGVGFDAVMSMAISLSPPPSLIPLVPFNGRVPDERWGKLNADSFAVLTAQFYADSKFNQFFVDNQALYAVAQQRLDTVIAGFDLEWFPQFFGVGSPRDFHVIIGMNNEPGNYGPHLTFPNRTESLYAILAARTTEGQPTFDNRVLPMLAHEFSHSFVNPAVEASWPAFSATNRLYDAVAVQMQKLAYGDAKTMVCESLVRAAVILNAESSSHHQENAFAMIAREQQLGFHWMPELCGQLRAYANERKRYKNFSAFMPQLASFFNHVPIPTTTRSPS